MIRRLLVLPLLVISVGAAAAPAKEWAKALFKDKLVHDFGTVAAGALAEHRFVLENIYQEDIEIGKPTAACGCTKLQATKNLLKMYETAEIVAELDTRKFTGFKEATINVPLAFRPLAPGRSPVAADVQLKLRAYIRKDVVFEPGSVQFDSVAPGQSVQKRVTVSYAGRADWRILEATSSSPHLAAAWKEVGRNPDPNLNATMVTYELAVTLKDTAPLGYFKEQVILKTNEQKQETARIPLAVEGYVVPSLTVNPTMLRLGSLKPGQDVSRNLAVSAAKPFRVVSVAGPDERFAFTKADDAKAFHLITVRFTADSKPGKIVGKIKIATDLDGGSVSVDVDGETLAGGAPGPARDSTPPPATKPDKAASDGNTLRTAPLREVEPAGEKTREPVK